MKNNTLKILLSTVNDSDQIRPITTESLHRFVVPGLSKSGFRSLLYLMKDKGYIKLQNASVYGQPQGWRSLLTEIPALKSDWDVWQGDWVCLVFLQAPRADRQFRYLRNWCIDRRYFQLTRGVYLAPTWYLKEMLPDLEGVYRHSIQVLTVGEWIEGDIREQILDHFDVMGLSDIYSGISNQYEQLLKTFETKKRLNEQQIRQIQSTFERTLDLLVQDLGLVRYYAKPPKTPFNLVESWQALLSDLGKTE